MKKVILLSAIFSLLFVNCSDDEGDIDSFGPNQTIVGFPGSTFLPTFATNLDDAMLNVPVNLISYQNETYPEDVTLQWTVDPSSTAVAGVDYDMPANTTVVLPAGSTVTTIPINVHPTEFDPENPKTIVLNLTQVSSNNAIIGAQYQQIVVTLQGVCVSTLAGNYSTVTTRIDNGVTYSHALEKLTLVEGSTYVTQFIGAYHGANQTPGAAYNPTTGATGATVALASPTAPYTFTEICGKLKVETQNLANYYSNEVRQNEAQFAASTVNEETGEITIHYSIFFTNNTVERAFKSVYTPL